MLQLRAGGADQRWYAPDRDILNLAIPMMMTVFTSFQGNPKAFQDFLDHGGSVEEFEQLARGIGKFLELAHEGGDAVDPKVCWRASGLADITATRGIDFFCRRLFVAFLSAYHKAVCEAPQAEPISKVEEFVKAVKELAATASKLSTDTEFVDRKVPW